MSQQQEKYTASDILKAFRKLQQIRKLPEKGFFGFIAGFFAEPRYKQHERQYDKLKNMVIANQDALYELVFSGLVTSEEELHELIFFGGHGGSVAKKDNLNWAPFIGRVRNRQSELPKSIQVSLDWLLRVHGY